MSIWNLCHCFLHCFRETVLAAFSEGGLGETALLPQKSGFPQYYFPYFALKAYTVVDW